MILEREAELAVLAGFVDRAGSFGGRVVMVRGEAGIGKSTLVTRFLSDCEDEAYTLLGACDDLLTPQPLAPVWDIARSEPTLSQPMADGDRRMVMEAVFGLLCRSLRPTVLVLEDTQWADEATLDLIKFLGRRIARTNGVLILTYRDVEVDADHPLRRVIGDLSADNIVRMPLSRLSPAAVSSMIKSGSFDVDEVLTLTGGNPLFVSEVLASETSGVPLSVSDAVLSRAAKVSANARRVLDLVSVVPGGIERSIADEMVDANQQSLAECSRQGMLRVDDDKLYYRHDLQRRAIESDLSSSDRRTLNQKVLDALGASADPARLVHHAEEAGDIDAIVEFAPRAARAAMAIESTTEAVAHYRTVDPYLDRIDIEGRAEIISEWAEEEAHLDNAEAVDLYERAIALQREVGDDIKLARTLTTASRVNRDFLRHDTAVKYAGEAVILLEPHGSSLDYARALGQWAFTQFVYTDDDAAVLPLIEQAMSVAADLDDVRAMVWALNVKGHLTFSRGDPAGLALMEESLECAKRSGDHRGEVVALANLAGMCGDVRDVARASDFAQRARDTAARYEMRSLEAYARSSYCEFELWKGDWASAENNATELLGSNPGVETLAWRVLASIQSRRGRNEARAAILHMRDLVHPDDGPTVIDPAAAAVAEYVWLSDDRDPEFLEQVVEVLDTGLALGRPWPSGALAFWMWKLGMLETAPESTADFYGWIIRGEYRKSADFWHQRGIPYEEGLALMHGDETEQIEAIRIFEDLGATATANKVREALVRSGVKVPRGKSRAARNHVAGLTARQAEVLELLASGLKNAEIANELFLSHRTVENHVSAVLMKLDAPSREAAVAAARDQGILAAP